MCKKMFSKAGLLNVYRNHGHTKDRIKLTALLICIPLYIRVRVKGIARANVKGIARSSAT